MTYLVVGAGLAGLVAAYKLSERFPGADITVLDKGDSVGGLLAGKLYENNAYFDFGTHIFQETGSRELDDFIKSAVSHNDLIEFPAGQGDISGVVFNQLFSERSHFPSLLGDDIYNALIADVLEHVSRGHIPDTIGRTDDLASVSLARFGKKYTESVILPLLSSMYQMPSDALSGFSLLLPGLSRVICVEGKEWFEKSESDNFRAVVGFPNQSDLPERFRHSRKSFYSRSLGSRSFVFGIAKALERRGVKILTDVDIREFNLRSGEIVYTQKNSQEVSFKPTASVIAIGAVGAARLLGVDFQKYGFDKPMKHRVVNCILSAPIRSKVFYLYGLDLPADYYRVTNYAAFSGDNNDCRISIEVLGDRGISDSELATHLISQLRTAGVIDDQTLVFSTIESLAAGFPAPTKKNMCAMSNLAAHVESILPENMILGGVGSRGGLFFQNEIILDVYNRIELLS